MAIDLWHISQGSVVVSLNDILRLPATSIPFAVRLVDVSVLSAYVIDDSTHDYSVVISCWRRWLAVIVQHMSFCSSSQVCKRHEWISICVGHVVRSKRPYVLVCLISSVVVFKSLCNIRFNTSFCICSFLVCILLRA